MLEILRAIIGLPVLAFLLYVPGAVVLQWVASRSAYSPPFSGRDEWAFTAVLISVLATGLVGFLLAQIGIFSPWLLLAIILIACLLTVALIGLARWRWSSVVALLKPPLPPPQRASERRQARWERIGLAATILVALVLFARPAEMLRGALDSGVYVDTGIAIGRTGAILQRDVLMRQLNDDTGEGRQVLQGLNPDRYTLQRLRMPGFYVLDKKAALVLPQHYSLFPTWVGLLYSLFGIWGALYTNPLLSVLAVLAVYYFARRALSSGSALLALALLVLCPVTIWFARYPVTEVLRELLAFGAFLGFLRMLQLTRESDLVAAEPSIPETTLDQNAIQSHPILTIGHQQSAIPNQGIGKQTWASLWGAVAGLSLGEMALAHPEFIFFLIPVPFYLIYWRLTRRWVRPMSWFAGTLGVMLGLYVVYFAFFSFAYTLDLYYNVIQSVRRLWGPGLLVLYLGIVLVVTVDRLYPRLRPVWARLESWVGRHRWVWAGVIALAVGIYALYLYVIAPWLPNIRFDKAGKPIPQAITTTLASYIGAPVDEGGRYNFLRIGWYLSPLGIVVGVAGLLRFIWARLSSGTGLFFASLVIISLIFMQETYTDPHYIYTMRRYVPIVLPALFMGFAWACQFLWSRLRLRYVGAVVGGALALALAVFFVYTSRTIIPHVEEQGAVAQLTQLADHFKPASKSVVIFSNERDEPFVVATPLQYVFGVESFVINPSYPQVRSDIVEGMIKNWQKQGYKVWVMMGANGGKLHFNNFSLKEEGTWQYSVPEFEQLRQQKPTNVSRSYLPWGIYSVQPAAAPPLPPYTVDIGDQDYQWLVSGFYIEEISPGDTSHWRWTSGHAVLRVPWGDAPGQKSFTGGTITLRMRGESPSANKVLQRTQPLTVTLTLDDAPIGQVVVPPGSAFKDYAVTVPPGLPKSESDPGTALLHIHAPTWSPQEAGVSGDTRVLGVEVDSVQVTTTTTGLQADPANYYNEMTHPAPNTHLSR